MNAITGQSPNARLLETMQQIAVQRAGEAVPYRTPQHEEYMKSLAQVVGEKIGLNDQEQKRFKRIMGLLFPEEKSQGMRYGIIGVRAKTLAQFLKSTTCHKALTTAGLVFEGRISKEFKRNAETEWEMIPIQIRGALEKNGFKLSAADTTLTAFPDYAAKVLTTDDADNRSHATHVSGMFQHNRFTACSSEYYLDANYSPKEAGYKPTPSGILDGQWLRAAHKEGTVAHETAHAFDKLILDNIGTRASQLPSFKKAYASDLAELGGLQKAREKGYAYCARKDRELSRIETFAELSAVSWGAIQDKSMANAFPRCAAYILELTNGFSHAYDKGLTARYLFLNSLLPTPKTGSDVAVCNKWLCELQTTDKLTKQDVRDWAAHAPARYAAYRVNTVINNTYEEPQKNDRQFVALIGQILAEDKEIATRHPKLAAMPALKPAPSDAEQPTRPDKQPQARIHAKTHHT